MLNTLESLELLAQELAPELSVDTSFAPVSSWALLRLLLPSHVSGSSRISWDVAALAREAVRNARKELRSIVLVCFEGWCLNMIS